MTAPYEMRRLAAATEAAERELAQILSPEAFEPGDFHTISEQLAHVVVSAADRVTPDDHVDHAVLRELGVEEAQPLAAGLEEANDLEAGRANAAARGGHDARASLPDVLTGDIEGRHVQFQHLAAPAELQATVLEPASPGQVARVRLESDSIYELLELRG